MKLSIKMVILFSVIIILAMLILSSYAVQTSIDGANTYTQSRVAYMSENIRGFLEDEYRIMNLTLTELADNTSFMAALNQFVRDDSADQKMADAAMNAVLQQLYQSPLVNQFYRVSFFTADGITITSRGTQDSRSYLGPVEPFVSAGIPMNPAPMELGGPVSLLHPHPDVFDPAEGVMVYGVAQTVLYRGKELGTIVILNECSDLERITDIVDDTAEISVEVDFDDGGLLYSTSGESFGFPSDLPTDGLQPWTVPETDARYNVMRTHVDLLDLELFVAQDNRFTLAGNRELRINVAQRMLLIMVPAIILIILVSYALTRSIRRLTKKVGQMPVTGVLERNASSVLVLTDTVTSPSDREIHELEQTYNHMMLQLRDSTLNELALREGTLQAQFQALQAQINPHFIYNTLNIISAKSMESGNYDVIEICDQFASMLRYSSDTRSRTATMEEEIENVRNYLLLAKARFEDNLEFVIDVPEDLRGIEVPKLTLQPLVENALNHGYDGVNTLRRLSVVGTISDRTLILEIRDDGTGFPEAMLENLRRRIQDINEGKVSIEESNSHIGLVNTCMRLHLYSNGAMRISIRNDGGAVITLTMPVKR